MSIVELERTQSSTETRQPAIWSVEDVALFVKTHSPELEPPVQPIEVLALTGLVNVERPLTDRRDEWDTRFNIVNAAVHEEAGRGDQRHLEFLQILKAMRLVSTTAG